MESVHAVPRDDVRLRCPLCHERLIGVLQECPGCQTRFHAACLQELGEGCTTLGCARGPQGAEREQPLKAAPAAPERSGRDIAVRFAGAVAAIGLLVVTALWVAAPPGLTVTIVSGGASLGAQVDDSRLFTWSWESRNHAINSLGYRWAGALDIALTDQDPARRDEAEAAARALESLLQLSFRSPQETDVARVLRFARTKAQVDVDQTMRDLSRLPLVTSAADARAFLARGAVLHALELVHRDVIRSSLVDALVIASDAGAKVTLDELVGWIADEARFLGGIELQRARLFAFELLLDAGQAPPNLVDAPRAAPIESSAPIEAPIDPRLHEERALAFLNDLLGRVQARGSVREVLPDAVSNYAEWSRSSTPPCTPGLLRAAIRAGLRACETQGEPIPESMVIVWAMPRLRELGVADPEAEARRLAKDLFLGLR